MESKTKSENYYNALIDDPIRAAKILNEILEEDERKGDIEENDKNSN